jgi:hypothetical protein
MLLAFGSIAVLHAPAAASAAPAILVVDESGQEHSISADQFAKLPRKRVTGEDRDGMRHTWEGPLVADVLKSSGVALEKELRGQRLMLCLVVEAADGYRVVFALPEIDPTNADTSVILADRRDGSAMDAKEGPLRIIAPNEKRHARWVRQVTRLVIEKAPVPKRNFRLD